MKMKANSILLLFVMLFVGLLCASGQTTEKGSEFYKVPAKYCLIFVVMQNDSPIQFEGVEVLLKRNQTSPFLNWGLKNNSAKTVRRFQVAFKIRTNVDGLRSTGGGFGYDFTTKDPVGLIPPNGTYKDPNPSTPLPEIS